MTNSRQAIAFSLDSRSAIPPYLQLVQQVEDALRSGSLVEGSQLPRVKDVVRELAINPNTVLKAYRELESRGITSGRQGVGTFIVAAPPGAAPDVILKLADELCAGWLQHALEQGLDEEAILTVVRRVLSSIQPSSDSQ